MANFVDRNTDTLFDSFGRTELYCIDLIHPQLLGRNKLLAYVCCLVVVMEVDELAVGEPSEDDVKQSKNPLEKMRVRLAAENYNKPNNYQTMRDESDDENTTGLCNNDYTAE